MLRSLAGILVGGVLCLLMTCAGNVVLPSIFVHGESQEVEPVTLQSQERRPPERIARSAVALEPVPPVIVWVVGFIAGVLGGYYAALIARRAEVLHGVLSGWPVLLFPLLFLMASRGTQQLTFGSVVTILFGFAFSGMGGWLRYWQTNAGQA